MTPAMDRQAQDYAGFGLRIRSRIGLPELTGVEPNGEADVEIEIGSVPAPPGGVEGLLQTDSGLILVVSGVARFLISNGARIIVDPVPEVPERNVRLYLLGSAFGALLHQRGLLPLHANTVEIDGRLAAFMGASGEGKSTLAAWFHDHGYRVISDDVSVVRRGSDSRISVAPGQQRLRLWRDALDASGRDSSTYSRSFLGHDEIDKYDVPFPSRRGCADERELAAVYVLESADRFSIEPLTGLEAAEAVFSHTYRGRYVSDAGTQQQHWSSAVAVIRSIPIFRLKRPRDLLRMDEDSRRILDHFASVIPDGR
jgi:hypothetical protein